MRAATCARVRCRVREGVCARRHTADASRASLQAHLTASPVYESRAEKRAFMTTARPSSTCARRVVRRERMHAEHPITSHLVLAELLVYAHAEVESELAPPSADEVDAGWEGLHVGHGGRLGHLVGIWFPADNERVQQRHRVVVVQLLRSVEGSRQQHHRRRPAQLPFEGCTSP